jgi:hypothetical protein
MALALFLIPAFLIVLLVGAVGILTVGLVQPFIPDSRVILRKTTTFHRFHRVQPPPAREDPRCSPGSRS